MRKIGVCFSWLHRAWSETGKDVSPIRMKTAHARSVRKEQKLDPVAMMNATTSFPLLYF